MATFRYFIEARHRNVDGTHTVRASINHNSTTVSWSTDIRVLYEDFDTRKQCVTNMPNRRSINDWMNRYRWAIEDELRYLTFNVNLRRMTAQQIKDIVFKKLYPEQSEKRFVEVFEEFNATHTNPSTNRIYAVTLKQLRAFEPHIARYYFEEIDAKFLRKFDAWLQTKPNTRAMHLRNIRAVFNYAINEDITKSYPFRKVKIKYQRTPKRALDIDTLRRLFCIHDDKNQLYLDAFKLIFLMVGINIGDLCDLKKSQIVGGRVEYYRKKTGRFYSIKIEPEAQEIINKYVGKKNLLSFAEKYKNGYINFSMRMNTKIKEFEPGISTYWARHSWATIAASLDIPKDTIAHALGHGGYSVTDIYIDFDHKKIDDANRKVIDYLFEGIKNVEPG